MPRVVVQIAGALRSADLAGAPRRARYGQTKQEEQQEDRREEQQEGQRKEQQEGQRLGGIPAPSDGSGGGGRGRGTLSRP